MLDVLIEQAGALADDIDSFVALLKMPEGTQRGQSSQAAGFLISTMHGAKGLEWSRVMLWGLNEEECPRYSRDMPLSDSRLDEERRLFYVGVTRACDQLVLVNDGGQHRPSRFLTECAWQDAMAIRKACLSAPKEGVSARAAVPVTSLAIVKRYVDAQRLPINVTAKSSRPKQSEGMGGRPATPIPVAGTHAEWQLGDQVHHAQFGDGRVVHVRGSGAHCVIDVQFDRRRGMTTLMAARAPLARR